MVYFKIVSLISTILDVQADCATFESSHSYISTSASPTSWILYCIERMFFSHSSDMKCVFAEALSILINYPSINSTCQIWKTNSLSWKQINYYIIVDKTSVYEYWISCVCDSWDLVIITENLDIFDLPHLFCHYNVPFPFLLFIMKQHKNIYWVFAQN